MTIAPSRKAGDQCERRNDRATQQLAESPHVGAPVANGVPGEWLARKDSNLQSPDPESGALPFGHSPAALRDFTPGSARGRTSAHEDQLEPRDDEHDASASRSRNVGARRVPISDPMIAPTTTTPIHSGSAGRQRREPRDVAGQARDRVGEDEPGRHPRRRPRLGPARDEEHGTQEDATAGARQPRQEADHRRRSATAGTVGARGVAWPVSLCAARRAVRNSWIAATMSTAPTSCLYSAPEIGSEPPRNANGTEPTRNGHQRPPRDVAAAPEAERDEAGDDDVERERRRPGDIRRDARAGPWRRDTRTPRRARRTSTGSPRRRTGRRAAGDRPSAAG